MDNLPCNILQLLTKYLSLSEYKNLQLCNKDLYNRIEEVVQDKEKIQNVGSLNIFEMYPVFKRQSEQLSKMILHCNQEISYDLEWCKERFHSERRILTKGLTQEQKQIINEPVQSKKLVLIQAFAGTGKTTTLLNVAKHNYHKKVLYLTFNRSLVDSAKANIFIDNLTICTMHSLALNGIENNNFEIGKLSLKFIEERLSIDRKESTIVRNILQSFFSSNSKTISQCHVTSYNLLNEEYFINLAGIIWQCILNKECKVPHDAYLKMFQLQKVVLDYDIIMLDEAQDSTECMLSILYKQKHACIYLVGDIHQQIYGFRNVTNPFNCDRNRFIKDFSLSQSFRYGYEVAHVSNMFLNTFKNEKKKITSIKLNTDLVTTTNSISGQYTIITRTNTTLLKEAFVLPHNVSCHILGKDYNFDKECMYVSEMQNIEQGGQSNLPKFRLFHTIMDMTKYYQELSNFKWLLRIHLFKEYGAEHLIENFRILQNKIVAFDKADVVISTVHQAKGLEFDNVKLSDDFIPLTTQMNTLYVYQSKTAVEGYNLFYVAMTRAKKKLILNSELYNFLKIKKGQRKYTTHLSTVCNNCKANLQSVYTEEGINCLGFNSKILKSKQEICKCKI
jgi:F-box protein 18 (helicase)